MNINLTIDGKAVTLGEFIVPEMSLSSSKAKMTEHEFAFDINASELIKSFSQKYLELVAEFKLDDEKCGTPQDEIGEAGYPALDRLVENPALVKSLFGYYFVSDMFDIFLPCSGSRISYWLDKVDRCEVKGKNITFIGTCYSEPK